MSITISELPTEVLHYTLSFTSPKTMCRIAGVCKAWKAISDDESYWRNLCRLEGWNDKPSEESWRTWVIAQIKRVRDLEREQFFDGGCLKYEPIETAITNKRCAKRLWQRCKPKYFFPYSNLLPTKEIAIFEKECCSHMVTFSHKKNIIRYLISDKFCVTLDEMGKARVLNIEEQSLMCEYQLEGKFDQYSFQVNEKILVAIEKKQNMLGRNYSTINVYFFGNPRLDYLFEVSGEVTVTLQGAILAFFFTSSSLLWSQTNRIGFVDLQRKERRYVRVKNEVPSTDLWKKRLIWKNLSLYLIRGKDIFNDSNEIKWKFSNVVPLSIKPAPLQIKWQSDLQREKMPLTEHAPIMI